MSLVKDISEKTESKTKREKVICNEIAPRHTKQDQEALWEIRAVAVASVIISLSWNELSPDDNYAVILPAR